MHRIKIAFLIFCTLTASFLFFKKYRNDLVSISAVSEKTQKIDLSQKIPFYLQGDKRWRNETIGGSNQKMAGVGCTLCCLSMALSANGYVIDPLILNREIKKNKGYTKTGLLIWNSVYRITKNKYKVAVPAFPSHSEIDDQLKNKNPVIIKIFLNNVIYHWVLIVGKEENEYLVFDPLNHKKTARLLSEYESKIYSMRYVRKN